MSAASDSASKDEKTGEARPPVEQSGSSVDRILYDKLPLMYFTLDPEGTILSINRYGAGQLGYEPSELLGRSVLTVFHELDRRAARAALDQCLSRPGPVRSWGFRKLRKDGSVMWVRESARAVESGGRTLLLVVCEDVTDRREAQQQLIEYQSQLRILTSELALAEERERRRIAVGLHDEIGQNLAMVKRVLGKISQEVTSDRSRRRFGRAQRHLDQAIEAARSFTFELSSPVLYELGLVPAMENLGELLFSDSGIRFRFVCEDRTVTIDEKTKITVFRIARELLWNAVRHSRARCVTVSLRSEEQEMTLIVEDDGVGFDSSIRPRVHPNGGFGLFSVQEQLNAMGGWLEIDSAKGRGTRVVVLVPLLRSREEYDDG